MNRSKLVEWAIILAVLALALAPLVLVLVDVVCSCGPYHADGP